MARIYSLKKAVLTLAMVLMTTAGVWAQSFVSIPVSEIYHTERELPRIATAYPVVTEPNEDVLDYISQVSIGRVMADIQTLQDFGTRFFQHPSSVLAQNWLKEQFEMFGLNVELQEFPVPAPYNYSASDNIISIQYGTELAHVLAYNNTLPANDYDEHCYTVSAIYGHFGESEFSNESCASVPVGITEFDSKFHIYPNPTDGEFKIENGELKIENVEIFDVMGKKIIFNFQLSTFNSINLSHLPNGIYFMRIQTENGVITRKVVKN